MAITAPCIETLSKGTVSNDLDKGPYYLNMERWADHWRVRRGFGQMAQFDTTFGNYNDLGHLGRLCGARAVKTPFGHEQIVAVYQRFLNYTVDCGVDYIIGGTATLPGWRPTAAYLVAIYDLTTGALWEELIHPGSGQSATIDQLPHAHAFYETHYNRHSDEYLEAAAEDVWWTEFYGTVIFGSPRLGVVGYQPCSFSGRVRQNMVNLVDHTDWAHAGRGEASLLLRGKPSIGLVDEGFNYMTTGEFPAPTVGTAFMGRMAYAAEQPSASSAGSTRMVYFSDANHPMAVVPENHVSVPAQTPITALVECRGNLMIFCEDSRWLYQPTEGFLINGGRLTKAADSIGCLGPNAVCRVENAIFWVDRDGAHYSPDGFSSKPISDDVADFWGPGISNPLTSYYQNTFPGIADLPLVRHDMDAEGLHVCYDASSRAFFIVNPKQRMALVRYPEGWSVWTFDSMFSLPAGVQRVSNIVTPWLVPLSDGLGMVSSEDFLFLDWGDSEINQVDSTSLCFLRYGRGQALDRSVEYASEDNRRLIGYYHRLPQDEGQVAIEGGFYIDEWIRVPEGRVIGAAAAAATAYTYLFPVRVVKPDTMASNHELLKFHFRFDAAHWLPFRRPGATNEIAAIFPAERINSVGGYSIGAPVAGLAEIRLYNSLTGLPDPLGDEVHIDWDGLLPGVNPQWFNDRSQNPLVYLPFRYVGPATDVVLTPAFRAAAVPVANLEAPSSQDIAYLGAWMWSASYFGRRYFANECAQAVDWAVKTAQLQAKDGEQVQTRGFWATV